MSIRAGSLSLFAFALLGCGASSPPPQTPAPVIATAELADHAARSLATEIDPSRGLVVVAHLEDQPEFADTPPTYVTGHRCTRPQIDEVATQLAADIALRPREEEIWGCGGDWCELPGAMEYDPARAIQFGRDASGRVVVLAISLFDQPGVPDEQVDQFRARGQREASELASRCP